MVDFLIVGTPKSGTTALQSYLSKHPEIFMPEFKELHFFGSEFKEKHSKYSKSLTTNEYSNLFKNGTTNQLKGEASVFYLYSNDAHIHIKSFNPEMKIIVCFRHPVDFLISYHQDALYVEIENEKDFWKALALENKRKKGACIPKTTSFIKSLYYSELIDYASHLKQYISTFGKENVKVVFLFEELISNPQKEYKSILNFLNVTDTDFSLEQFEKVNPRRNIKNKSINNLIKNPLPLPFRFLLRVFFPFQKLRLLIYNKIKTLNTDYSKVNTLSHLEKVKLQKDILPNIIHLEKVLETDLSVWKNKYI